MGKLRSGFALLLTLAGASVGLLLPAGPLRAQDIAASAATAEGYEGLEYNPAAVAALGTRPLGFAGLYGAADEYGLSAVLSDGLRLNYGREGADEQLELLYALAFPRESALRLGVRAAADLLDFQWNEVDLAAGLLWYPHRYLALAAVQENLRKPAEGRTVFGLGLRPFTERLTLFGDLVFPRDFSNPDAALGFRAEPVPGVRAGWRLENGFSDFIGSVSVTVNALSLDFTLAGALDLDQLRLGTGIRYQLRPPPSVLDFSPRICHIRFDRPIDPGSTQRGSLNNLDTLVARLYRLAEQPRLETLVLSFETSTVRSIQVLEELVEVFAYLQHRGKRIVSYLDSSYSEWDYLAAAAGTTVVAAPYTLVPLVGVGARQLYFRQLFEELGIEVEYARSSEYKSALDRFLREGLSEENRRQLEAYLSSSYELILDVLVASRGLSRERAVRLIDGGPYWSEEAVELGLVDQVAYYREFEET